LKDRKTMHNQFSDQTEVSERCAIVLAAGEGRRLRPLVERLRGDTLPKQYVKFLGGQSMLQATWHRAERLVPPERIFTVVGRGHLRYAEAAKQLAARGQAQVVLQPRDRGTTMGLLLPLAHLVKRYPDATVALFPSDHFVSDDECLIEHVGAACDIVERDGTKIVLLGVDPTVPEPEYGYIVPDKDSSSAFAGSAWAVGQFVEKPSSAAARGLIRRGGLWNTLIMVFKAPALADRLRTINGNLYACFERMLAELNRSHAEPVFDAIYEQADSMNLSKGFLGKLPEHRPSDLLVLRVGDLRWSDWGSEARIVRDLKAQEINGKQDFGASKERMAGVGFHAAR
jgi:mannose-1-phosphate guanylyltransferase